MSTPNPEPGSEGGNYLSLPAVIMLILLAMVLYAGYWLMFGIAT